MVFQLSLFWKKYSQSNIASYSGTAGFLLIAGFLFGSLIFLGGHLQVPLPYFFISRCHAAVDEASALVLVKCKSQFEHKPLFIEDLGASKTPSDDDFHHSQQVLDKVMEIGLA